MALTPKKNEELRYLTPLHPSTLRCFISVSILWVPVEVPYFDVTMVELRSLTPPPLRPKLLHICVSFMNSCWSPVFWCNNGGTSLSHRPPFALNCFISVSVLWIPVEVPYFDVTMVELRSLTPPPFALNCFISVSVLWIPVEVPYFDVTMVELRSLTPPPFALNCFISVSVLWIPVEVPYFDVTMVELCSLTPPPLRPKLLHFCVSFMNPCWSPVFWCNNGGTSLSHPTSPLRPKLLHIYLCQFYEFLLKSRILM